MTDTVCTAADSGCPLPLVADQDVVAVEHVGFDGFAHRGELEVHGRVAGDVASFFALARTIDFPIECVVRASDYGWDDARLMAANCSSGFNFRTVAGTRRLSLHSFGLAFDVNCRLNPYLRRDTVDGAVTVDPSNGAYEPTAPGTLAEGHPLVRHLTGRGWTWGGHWTLDDDGCIDYQHFQLHLTHAERVELFERYGLPADR